VAVDSRMGRLIAECEGDMVAVVERLLSKRIEELPRDQRAQ
jgi:hypothetical protein